MLHFARIEMGDVLHDTRHLFHDFWHVGVSMCLSLFKICYISAGRVFNTGDKSFIDTKIEGIKMKDSHHNPFQVDIFFFQTQTNKCTQNLTFKNQLQTCLHIDLDYFIYPSELETGPIVNSFVWWRC